MTLGTAPAPPATLPERVAARLGGGYPRWVLLVALAGMFATTFPVTVLALAIPTIADDFGVDEAGLSWLITLPVLGSALALPVLGKLGDLYGHRKVFIGGFAIALVTTALTATAPNPAALIAWRTLTQVAGGSTMPSSLALINSVHHGPARARAMGWWSMVSAGAPVVGLTVGGPVIDAVGWPTLFLMQAVLMVVPVLASWLVLRETPRRPARFDVAGAVALAVGLGPLMLAVDRAPDWGFTALPTIACLAVGIGGLVAFATIERRVAAPLVPLTFFRSRATTSTLLAALASNGAYMGAFFLASLLMVKQFDYSLTSAVPILSIRPALFAVASPLGGWVTARAGSRVASVVGCVVLAGGLSGLAVGAAVSSLLVVVLVGFLLQGIGFGLLRPAISTALANAVEERDLGMAGASERLAGQLGTAFCITLVATVYASDVDRFPAAFGVAALIASLGALASTGLRAQATRSCPTVVAPDPAV
jgi:MFS family permease